MAGLGGVHCIGNEHCLCLLCHCWSICCIDCLLVFRILATNANAAMEWSSALGEYVKKRIRTKNKKTETAVLALTCGQIQCVAVMAGPTLHSVLWRIAVD